MWFPRGILALLALLALVACGAPTPYAPIDEQGRGYATVALAEDRYRISFSGNALTPRATVEDYLLFRAAEVTLARGAAEFTVADRMVEPETRLRATGIRTGASGPYPGWPYRSPHGGVATGGELRPVTRYDAALEIVLGRAGPAAQVYDARAVRAAIGLRVVRPAEG
jgi:hypothetical protein